MLLAERLPPKMFAEAGGVVLRAFSGTRIFEVVEKYFGAIIMIT